MQKTDAMELIEARAGKDIRQVLREAYEETGNLTDAADLVTKTYGRLVTFGLISDWIARLDGQIVKTLEFVGFDPDSPSTAAEACAA